MAKERAAPKTGGGIIDALDDTSVGPMNLPTYQITDRADMRRYAMTGGRG